MSLWVAAVICRQINMDMEIALFLGLFFAKLRKGTFKLSLAV